jgi:hypothetical protein
VTVGASRALAAWNALTGISTAGSIGVTVRKPERTDGSGAMI